MAKNKKIIRYRKPFHINIGLIVFGIIFVYMMYSVYAYLTTKHISVYEVIHGSIAINNSYVGLALREEEIVDAQYSGILNYYRKDAAKARAGDLVCSIDTDGTIAKQIHQAGGGTSALTSESIASLEKKMSEYAGKYRPQAFYQIYTFKNDLNAELSEARNIEALRSITGAVEAAEGNATFHKETAPRDGIVTYYTDGFETVTMDTFTPKLFDMASYAKSNLKERTEIRAGEPLYKLITSENWKLIIPIPADAKRRFLEQKMLSVRFEKDGTTVSAPFTMEEKEGQAYLVLALSHSMIRFASDRYIEVKLLFEEEEGLKIPNSAITAKDFFVVPMEYFQKGSNSSRLGVILRKTDKDGNSTDSFVTPEIYFATETCYYTDGVYLADGDTILKPKSNEIFTIHETAKMDGVYCINKGYAVFRMIDPPLYQNSEYAIIRSGTKYGISLYDHIALEGSAVTEDAIVNP